MTELFLSAFAALFVVIDPPGCIPIYAGLTGNATPAERRSMAIRAVAIAAGILLLFALAGEKLLATLGIDLDSFRIAGGIMLFLIALEMVFEVRTQKREDRAQRIREREHHREPAEDVSVFPMAMPMIAGPGSIATVMLLMGRAHGPSETAIVLGALALNLGLMLGALLLSSQFLRLMGEKIEAVVTRLLGVILAALAVQFVMDGVRGSLG